MEHIVTMVLRSGLTLAMCASWEPDLLEGSLVHILEQLVLLSQLVLKDHEFRIDLTVLVAQVIDLHLRVHVLLVEILPRLQSHGWNLALQLPGGFIRRAEDCRRVVMLACYLARAQSLRSRTHHILLALHLH